LIFAEIDEHPCIAHSRRPHFSPINKPTSVASRCNFLSSSSLFRFLAADTAWARSSYFLRSALRSCSPLGFIISGLYTNTSIGISVLNPVSDSHQDQTVCKRRALSDRTRGVLPREDYWRA
jgi:hypothetical protein